MKPRPDQSSCGNMNLVQVMLFIIPCHNHIFTSPAPQPLMITTRMAVTAAVLLVMLAKVMAHEDYGMKTELTEADGDGDIW